jgi:hypothetical protein
LTLTDEELIKRYLELGESASALAKEQGVHHSTVLRRLKKLDVGLAKASIAGGAAAIMVSRSLPPSASGGVARGMELAGQQYDGFAVLDELVTTMQTILYDLKKEMADHRARKGNVKGYHVDLVCKVSAALRGSITDIHKLKRDLFELKGTQAFMMAVVSILEEEIPDVRLRLFAKLAQLGFEGQTAFHGPGKVSGCPPDGDDVEAT